MNIRAEFDIGPLTWVKGEIDQSLEKAGEALRAFAADHGATDKLKHCQAHLHQAHGALQIVGLDGLTRFSEELEQLLAALDKQSTEQIGGLAALGGRSFGALSNYLDRLVNGEPHVPLRLFPLYSELLAARGIKDADASDLYYPDLSHRPPDREKPPISLDAAELTTYFKEQRGKFQRGLLKWIRKDEQGMLEMREAVASIEASQALPAQRAFWWVALGFFDALIHNALPPDANPKPLLSRIEQQIKRMLDGSPNVAERLLREALYFVAHASPATDHLRDVQDIFELAGTLPGNEPARPEDASVRQPLIRVVHDAIGSAKDAWNKFASGNQSGLVAFSDQAAAIRDNAALLDHAGFAGLTSKIAALAVWLSGKPQNMSEAIAMEVATALLLCDSALENFHNLPAEFAQQAQVMGARLEACVLGEPHSGLPGVPLLDEMSRSAQQRLATGQVIVEMQANLRLVEQVLDAFFRDPGKRSELAALDRPVKQVLGALSMLGEEEASAALRDCLKSIESFARTDNPAQGDFETLAQTLSGLSFYIDALQFGKADFVAAMQPIGAKKPAVASAERGTGEVPVPSTVEAQLERQKRDAQALLETFKQKPADRNIKEELRKNLAAIQEDANLVADAGTANRAEKALSLLAQTGVLSFESLAKAIGDLAPPAADAPAPSAAAEKMLDASVEAVDAELLQIYLEEAGEVLATIDAELQQVRGAPQNQASLTTIRRGFHTLKGSGRMVGLTRLGEAAWSVERSINLWLEENRAATPDLLILIAAAHAYFSESVAKLMQGAAAGDEQSLIATADMVREGKPLETEPAGPALVTVSQAMAVVDAAAPSAAPAAEAPAIAVVDTAITIGPLTLTPALYEIFLGEAGNHLAAMQREYEMLTQHGVITDDFMRAAHTLGGIAGTVKLMELRELGYGLERALQQLSFRSVSPDEQAIIENAIAGLESMVAAVREKRMPDAAPGLVAELDQLAKPQTEDPMAERVPEVAALSEPPTAAPTVALPAVPAYATSAADPPAVDAQLPGQASADDMVVEEIPMERRTQRMLDEIDPELLPIFLDEANELVPEIGAGLRGWRENPKESGPAQSLRRVLHTLKGSARMAGAMALGELTHHMESRVEDAVQLNAVPASLFNELDTAFDRMSFLMDSLRSPRALDLAATMSPIPAGMPAPIVVAEPLPQAVPASAQPTAAEPAASMLRVRAAVLDRLVNQAGEVAIARSRIEGEMRIVKGLIGELTENVLRLRGQLREIEIQAETQMQSQQTLAQETRQGFDALEFDRFTRFQELTRLMAESVSDVSTVHQNLLKTLDDTDAALLSQARINRDLQQDLMRVRMVPFQSIAERLYRIVRLSAKETAKRANLDIHGGQVEMDRSVLERITAPFEHLLRNAITHGLEAPAERVAAGKAETGEIRLDLRQEGNDVVLTLADDGAGLDLPRIRAKAIAGGLMRESDTLTDAEIAEFIFRPGFSTASVVSELAGRGVGMDVVKTEIAGLGGRVKMHTEAGKGTHFSLYLPLTLAVTQSVLVRAGSRNYAFPAVMVEQVRQMRVDELRGCYETRQAEWQTRRYPFYNLQQLLGEAPTVAEAKRFSPVLFLKSGISVVAMHVDDIVGNQEIVVKNIGPQLARVQGIAGATVLGSGEIVLILNPVQLATRGAIYTPVLKCATPEEMKAAAAPIVMVVDDSLTVRKITGRLLSRESYRVVTAKDGVDALEQLQEILPEVMLVDIEMPRMDGFDLTRNVRADPRLKHIPIIMITSRTAEKHQNYAREIGVDVFLGKPFQENELLGHIAGLIKAKPAT